jgi:peroxiredoxin
MKPILLTTLTAAFALTATAAEPLKKGDAIPDVAVRNADNQSLALRQLAAEKPTVLIFYRGGWCPYCTKHLGALATIQDELKAAGFQLLAISMDQPSKIKETPNFEQLNYLLLSDSDATAAEAFGLVFTVPDDLAAKYKNQYQIDLEAASGQTHHKLPHPAVFVVSPDGTIQFAYVNEDYKVRLDPRKILEAAQAVTH